MASSGQLNVRVKRRALPVSLVSTLKLLQSCNLSKATEVFFKNPKINS